MNVPSSSVTEPRESATPSPTALEIAPFQVDGFHGEIVSHLQPAELQSEIDRLIDPATADATIHWGRNYLYRTHLLTPQGPLPVVVKQFRNQGWKARLRRRIRGSKAAASWRMACAFSATGVATAAPVMLIDNERHENLSLAEVDKLLEGAK